MGSVLLCRSTLFARSSLSLYTSEVLLISEFMNTVLILILNAVSRQFAKAHSNNFQMDYQLVLE